MQTARTEMEKEPTKILLVIPTLAFGGAERVLLTLIQAMDRSTYEPVVAALSNTGPYRRDIPGWVCVHDLGRRSRLSFPTLVLKVADLLETERPDVAIGFTGLANFVLLLAHRIARTPTRVMVTEHINPTQMYRSQEEPLGGLKRKLIRWLYPAADRIIAVSQGVMEDLVTNFAVPREKIAVIYDPVDLGRIRRLADEPVDHPWFSSVQPVILSAGRMTPQKDFPTLLRAFAVLRRDYPARLVLLGDGPETARLRGMARNLGVADHTAFMGYQPNPYKYMAKATVFALSSRFEGFGLVLVEAMASGVPVVSTHCPSGPDEILNRGSCGLLVPVGDHRRLASAITRLLLRPDLRRWFAACGRTRANRFSADRIASQYQACIADLTSQALPLRDAVPQLVEI
jgi:glycosyltransferase involved in cell wall biosynthesis